MRRLLLVPFLACAGLAAAAPPPPPAPMLSFQGRDQVLIGRIYVRTGGQTQPIARFGTIIADKSVTQAVSASSPETGPFTVTFTAKRDGGPDAARASWSVQPGGGARIAAGQGVLTLREGSVGHAALGKAGESEVFGSLETGRASGFNLQRLWDHFGVVTEPRREPRQAPAEWQPQAMAAPAPPPPARGGSISVSCASGKVYDLSTGSGQGRCRVDVSGDAVAGGSCDDGEGNAAEASCTLNSGQGGCLSASGAGTCRLR